MIAQFMRYSVAGGIAAAAHFGVLVLLVEAWNIYPTTASGVGFCIAGAINYTLQYHWTFKASGPHTLMLSRYIVVTLAMLLVNLLIFWLLNEQLGVFYFAAQVVATGIVVFLNFTINRRWTFVALPHTE